MTEEPPTQNILEIPITVTDNQGKPCIILKKSISNMDLIQAIVQSAFSNQPLVILPKFTDKTKSVTSLIQKGILYRNNQGEYYFTF